MQYFIRHSRLGKVFIFGLIAAFCLSPWVSSPVALLLGIILAQFSLVPFEAHIHTAVKYLLQISVVGLGFGMNLKEALQAGKEGLLLTICSIFLTLGIGLLLGKKLKINQNTTLLIAAGTAICGGSAIAALAPLIKAKHGELSVALGTIFILNAVALFVFPWIGECFHLSQNQFGLWSAVAIHDTSSVVAASGKYGVQAMHIATTVKLERALWIIPVSLLTISFYKSKNKSFSVNPSGAKQKEVTQGKISIPYFILWFILAMLGNTFIEQVQPVGAVVVPIAEKLLTLTLFLIGAGLSRKAVKAVGIRPFLLGILLWIFISCLAFWVINNWVA